MFGFRFGSQGQKGSDNARQGKETSQNLAAMKQAEQERAQRTQQDLAQGRLPADVANRMRKSSAGELPWTSDLTVSEWAVLRPYRLRPLGQVMGSAFYHVGFIAPRMGGFFAQSQELQAPTRALYEGRRLAMTRLRQEAESLGANAVVGVHVEQKPRSWEQHTVEYVCYGTAVRVEGLPPSVPPLLATVSGQDFARLLAAGALPVGLALGASFYYLLTDWWDIRQERSWYNQEMQHFQRGVSQVRHLVQQRLREDIQQMEGSGVVGADFDLHVEEHARGNGGNNQEEIIDHILEAVMLGTAVQYVADPPRRLVQVAVNLRDA